MALEYGNRAGLFGDLAKPSGVTTKSLVTPCLLTPPVMNALGA